MVSEPDGTPVFPPQTLFGLFTLAGVSHLKHKYDLSLHFTSVMSLPDP